MQMSHAGRYILKFVSPAEIFILLIKYISVRNNVRLSCEQDETEYDMETYLDLRLVLAAAIGGSDVIRIPGASLAQRRYKSGETLLGRWLVIPSEQVSPYT